MITVSNTSPIINLATVGHLSLLSQLYTEIYIPEAVYSEIAVVGAGQPGSDEVKNQGWFIKTAVSNQITLNLLKQELDEGEAEAIALALELPAELLLMDERRGRAVAIRLGLKPVGIMGILIEAKAKQFIPAVKPILDDLRVKAGFWITTELYNRVMQVAGEDG